MFIIPEGQSNFRNFMLPFAISKFSLYNCNRFGFVLYLTLLQDSSRYSFLLTFVYLPSQDLAKTVPFPYYEVL